MDELASGKFIALRKQVLSRTYSGLGRAFYDIISEELWLF